MSTIIGKKQSNHNDLSRLLNFAFCDTFLDEKLKELAALAEEEYWGENNEYLRYFIFKTFGRCYKTKLLSKNKAFCLFNTGLLTENGEDIICLLKKNDIPDQQPWLLEGFFRESARKILECNLSMPKVVEYTTDYLDYYFNPNLEIVSSFDHILDDNWDRYPDAIRDLGKSVVKAQLSSSIVKAKKKVARNNRMVVLQYYKGQIMYLLPITFYTHEDTYTMALALEKIGNCFYRANTVFTLEDAYKKARLIMKPESNWLLEINKKDGKPTLSSDKTMS